MLTDDDIYQRYRQKQSEFERQAEITLIGHSLFDMWGDQPNGTPALSGHSVANLGISGVSTRQYLDVIVKAGKITTLGKHIFIFLGVNDIVKEPDYSPAQVLKWLNEILSYLKKISPNARYILLEATPVNNISTVDNPQIMHLNNYLEQHIPQGVTYLKTQANFQDATGKLASHLSTDGLHFNAEGYQTLKVLLESELPLTA